MKRLICLLLCIVFLLGACTPKAPPPATVSPTANIPPTSTNTPEPTATATALPSPTPLPEPISAENGAKLVETNRMGEGAFIKLLFSPDGQQVLAVLSTGLKLFDTEGHLLWKATTELYPLTAAFNKNEKTISVAYPGGQVETRDAASGEVIKSYFEMRDNITHVDLSSDGEKVMVTDVLAKSTLYDIASTSSEFENDGQSVPMGLTDINLSDDNKIVLITGWPSSNSFAAQIWDAESGAFLYGLRGIDFVFYQPQISPKGKYIAAIRLDESNKEPYSTLFLWETSHGEPYATIDINGSIINYVITPDNKTIYLTTQNSYDIKKIDIEEAIQQRKEAEKKLPANSISPIFIKPTLLTSHADFVLHVSVDGDGKQLLSQDANGNIKIWDTAEDEVKNSFKVDISYNGQAQSGFAFSDTGEVFARSTPSGEGIEIVETASGKTLLTLEGEKDHQYWGFSFSKDDKTFSAVDNEKFITIWDAKAGKVLKKINSGHRFAVEDTQFTPDGLVLASLGKGEIFLWDVKSGKKKSDMGGWSCMDFSPNGKVVAFNNADYGLYMVDTLTGKRLAAPYAELLYDIAYSPNGETIGLAGWQIRKQIKEHQNLVYFMEAEKPYERKPVELRGFASTATHLAFSPDGTLVAATDEYGSLYLFVVESGEQLAKVNAGLLAEEIFFTPDGRNIIVGGLDSTATFFSIR